jgi:four helix bundle protein
MSNIAEGFERNSLAEFRRYLSIAKGSSGELRAQLYVALDAGYLTADQFGELRNHAEEVGRILSGLMSSVSSQIKSKQK